MTDAIRERLDYLRNEIESEQISYEEIAELESLAEHIDPGDTLLLEWAGVPEFTEEEITLETHPVNGSLIVSTIHNGHLVTKVYYGYTRKEARQLFREHLSTLKE